MCPEWRTCESLAHAAEIEVGGGEGGKIIYDYSEDMKLGG